MKSGLAVMIELARRLDPDRLAFDLGLVFYDREEGPFKENGLERLLNEIPWLSGTTLGIVLEPTDLAVQMGCQGSIQSRVIFTGRSAHSARPWLGDNAIVKAGPFLTAMASSRPVDVDVQGLRFRECFTVTMARGGRAPNVVPDRVEFVLNFRFSPRRTLPEAREALRAFLDGLDLPASHRPELEIFDEAPSCPVYRDHPLVRAFVERAGVPVEPKQAWTDVARLAVHGIPAFNYGPGLVQQCHQAAEHTLVSHLDAAFDVLRSFLEAPVRESA
jgi:succinyl-diaminopimelate desuccinylase